MRGYGPGICLGLGPPKLGGGGGAAIVREVWCHLDTMFSVGALTGSFVTAEPKGAYGRDALEGKGPQRRPQERLGRRLEEVAKAVGGGYCRLQMPLRLAFAVTGTVAGHRLGALGGGGGVTSPPSNASMVPLTRISLCWRVLAPCDQHTTCSRTGGEFEMK